MRFDFVNLWKITRIIQQADPNDARLFGAEQGPLTAQNASLTQISCTAIAGSTWTPYSAADIWNRLTLWKFPLLTLVASFPRSPLGFWVEMFVVNHLLGSPISSLRDLFRAMSDCQNSAHRWQKHHQEVLGSSSDPRVTERNWKALAMIENAYAENGDERLAHKALRQLRARSAEPSLIKGVQDTAKALAADRATKSLIVVVLQCTFIGSVIIAIVRTAAAANSNATSDTTFINIEAHSIAFSAQFFWIIPAVFLGSIIGVSQTEAARPNILKRFGVDLQRSSLLCQSAKVDFDHLNQRLADTESRVFGGGVPSWQPLKHQSQPSQAVSPISTPSDAEAKNEKPTGDHTRGDSRRIEGPDTAYTSRKALEEDLICHSFTPLKIPALLLPYFIVVLGTAAGMTVSALVPPDGFDCRHIAQHAILVVWLVSAWLDLILECVFSLSPDQSRNRRRLFWCTYFKDLVATFSTLGTIITTQVGIFNRCSCYTRWGTTGLKLPEMPDVAAILHERLRREYPLIMFSAIVIELLIVPLAIWLWYGDAMRVFVQRDDERSNVDGLQGLGRLLCKIKSLYSRLWRRIT